MFEHTGDDLICLLKKLNIEIGRINHDAIKAWFDTDSENLLNWFCSSVTEENYISAQENLEYMRFKDSFTDENIEKDKKYVESEFPDLFQYDMNLFEIEIMENIIEVLEEQLKNCDNQLKINRQLNQRLSSELSKFSSEEIKSHLDRKTAQEICLKSGNKLDEVNNKSFDQILKYHIYLNNYEFAQDPEFISHMDIIEFEEKFADAITCLNAVIKVDDLLETSTPKIFINTLSQLQNRLFHSKISSIAIQMEVETFSHIQKFLDNYDATTLLSLVDCTSIQSNIEYNRSRQNCMLKVIEDSSLKLAEQIVSQPSLQCAKNELSFGQSRLEYLIKMKEGLVKILSHFVTMYDLYLQEKLDISSSNNFFKKVIQYISKDVQDSVFRREAMLNVIENYKIFNANAFENKFNLIANFGTFLSKGNQLLLPRVVEETDLMRNEIQRLEKKHFGNIGRNCNIVEDLLDNTKILQNFLVCGPTCRVMTISHMLQQILYDVNLNLDTQSSCVKLLMQIIQKPKDKFSEDKWFTHRRQLWMHFITDFTRMLAVLEQLKDFAKTFQQKGT